MTSIDHIDQHLNISIWKPFILEESNSARNLPRNHLIAQNLVTGSKLEIEYLIPDKTKNTVRCLVEQQDMKEVQSHI